ncbi:MAG TPA: tRNA pseudouridine(55) synthase TruB [Steroidobacteraceae bacterium]|nr:tRNA pseudouridine(55) synthase TruB [Steroidobacteraceae bacterium]
MPSGILLLDKPRGLSSNGALQRVRKAFKAKSAGHVGTLDPMATGMLPICLDEATKVIAEIESGGKAYEFTLTLGSRTDTGDADGQVVETQPVPVFDDAVLSAVLARFVGPQDQVPPMYSALKRDGRPLYELARQGIEVERAPRRIEIRDLALRGRGESALELVCECTKGTYIRVLGEDIARALGTVGHLTSLRRPWVEPFKGHPVQALEAVLAGAAEGKNLMSPDAALAALPRAALTAAQEASVRNGQAVQPEPGPATKPGQRVRLYAPDGVFVGLAEALPDGRLQPRRLLLPDAR